MSKSSSGGFCFIKAFSAVPCSPRKYPGKPHRSVPCTTDRPHRRRDGCNPAACESCPDCHRRRCVSYGRCWPHPCRSAGRTCRSRCAAAVPSACPRSQCRAWQAPLWPDGRRRARSPRRWWRRNDEKFVLPALFGHQILHNKFCHGTAADIAVADEKYFDHRFSSLIIPIYTILCLIMRDTFGWFAHPRSPQFCFIWYRLVWIFHRVS